MSIQLIDVTLRESVHVPNVPLALEDAQAVVNGLSASGIDFIEIGYVSDDMEDNYLPAYSPDEYIQAMADAIAPGSRSQLVLMLHPHQYGAHMLSRMQHPAVGMIRLCIPLAKVNQTVPLIRELKENGLVVSANLIRASHATTPEVLAFTRTVSEAGADYMYLADSNGAMLPQQVYELYAELHEASDIKLGFHPHDNLHLASANALESLRAGVAIMDGSIYGFGKGAGNLCIESFVACLKRMGLAGTRDLGKLIATSKAAYQNFIAPIDGEAYFIGEEGILTGYHNLNLDVQDRMESMAKGNGISLFDLLLTLENQSWVDRAQMILTETQTQTQAQNRESALTY
jgi:4-hydroxy 2-oxovalerate aldolase